MTAASVLIGPADSALTRMPLRPRSAARISARSPQARPLATAHDIVVRHDLLGAVIGQRQNRAAIRHQRFGAFGRRRSASRRRCPWSGRNSRASCPHSGRSAHPCWRRRRRGPRSRAGPRSFSRCAKAASIVSGSVTSRMAADDGVQFGRKRLDTLLQRVALIGEGQLGALFGAGFRDAPGNRLIVRKADDEASLAFHEARTCGHDFHPEKKSCLYRASISPQQFQSIKLEGVAARQAGRQNLGLAEKCLQRLAIFIRELNLQHREEVAVARISRPAGPCP